MEIKLKWKVEPIPTGRYSSFETRGWPSASWPCGALAAMIYCQNEYVPRHLASGEHGPLTVKLCHHNHPDTPNSWKLFTLKVRPKLLSEAKELVQKFYETHPDWLPKGCT